MILPNWELLTVSRARALRRSPTGRRLSRASLRGVIFQIPIELRGALPELSSIEEIRPGQRFVIGKGGRVVASVRTSRAAPLSIVLRIEKSEIDL